MSQSFWGTPVEPVNRAHELDVIRGFALIGILLANMPFFATPVSYLIMTDIQLFNERFHSVSESIIIFFTAGKFFTMFSFLFGIGFVFFLKKAEERIYYPKRLFARRMIILLVIGVIHGFGIWYGDILITYALTGFILMLFYSRKPKTILIWSILLITIPAVFMGIIGLLLLSMSDVIPDTGATVEEMTRLVQASFAAYGDGSWIEIMGMRVYDYTMMLSSYIVIMPLILGMFLLGVYTAKKEWHLNLSEQLPLIRKIWVISLLAGLPFNVLLTYSYFNQGGVDISGHMMLYYTGTAIGGTGMSIFYMTSLVLLMQSNAGRKILMPLAPAGRMALTNYLSQSIIMTFVFYNTGLGFYGKIGPLYWIIMAFILYAVQIWWSHVWFHYYRFGPAEWLWRSLTYGEKQPMRK